MRCSTYQVLCVNIKTAVFMIMQVFFLNIFIKLKCNTFIQYNSTSYTENINILHNSIKEGHLEILYKTKILQGIVSRII